MALYVTDGSTSRTVDPGIIWRQGNVQSSVNNVDIEYSSARDAGYGLFNLQLSNVDVSGYQLLATPMKSSGQIETTGSYGGIFAHGEGDADLDAATSDSFNNNRGFPPVSPASSVASDDSFDPLAWAGGRRKKKTRKKKRR